jgi:predicted GIY-YIG superfamily endonuclease
VGNSLTVTTNTRPSSASYDRTRGIAGARDQILAQLADLEREQRHAESMLIAAIIHDQNLGIAERALDEAMRSTGLVIPVDMHPRTSWVLDVVMSMLKAGPALTPDAIADEMRSTQDWFHDEVPLDFIARVCAIAPDTAERTPLQYARRIDEAAARRLQLGQRVWPEALYRWFDHDQRLLYIGITRDLATRQDSHARNSSWGRFAAYCTVERYPTRDDVETMERHAIKREQPLFNHTHNDTPEARQRLVAYLVEQGHLDLLVPAVSRG